MRENLGLNLDDAAGILFWSALEELHVPLYLHPWPSIPGPRPCSAGGMLPGA